MSVLIAAVARTPFALANHVLAGWHPVDLGAVVATEALSRAGISVTDVDELIVGCAEPVGAQGANLARAVALSAGWPDHISGMVIERGESSGTAALHAAGAALRIGQATTVVVAGICSASIVPPGAAARLRSYGRPWGRGPADRYEADGGLFATVQNAERQAAAINRHDRAAQEAWADRSRQHRSTNSEAIMAIGARPSDSVAIQKGTPVTADIRRFVPPHHELNPLFAADGTITAATFTPAADGIAAIVLTTEHPAPLGEIIGMGRAAAHPHDAAAGIARAAKSAGIDGSSVLDWHVAEPAAATALIMVDALGLEPSVVNQHGGMLSVGDAGAAEEIRLITDAIITAEVGDSGAAGVAGHSGSAVTVWKRL